MGERHSSPNGVEQVGGDQPHRAHQRAAAFRRAPTTMNTNPSAINTSAGRHLGWRARLAAAPREQRPQARRTAAPRSTMNDGIDRLEPGRRHQKPKTIAVGALLREQVHRRRRLLEPRPEQDHEREDHQQRDHAVALLARAAAPARPSRPPWLRSAVGRVADAGADICDLSATYNAEPEHHPHARRRRSPSATPSAGSPPGSRTRRPQQRARVDAHVEDGEAGVAARIALAIELPDHRRHVGLEEARPDDDQHQAGEERAAIGGTARQKWPAAMIRPPINIARRVPSHRSARQPPSTGST